VNTHELIHALHKLRLGGMAKTLETRLLEAQASSMAPIDLVSSLVSDELLRRADRLIERRTKHAAFRDSKTLDAFDFSFNKKMDRRLVFELATGRFIEQHEDALFLGPPGTGKSHLAQAVGRTAIQQGHRIIYREAHVLLAQLARGKHRRQSRRADRAARHRAPAHRR
jgi:DNA replication protein DnaC